MLYIHREHIITTGAMRKRVNGRQRITLYYYSYIYNALNIMYERVQSACIDRWRDIVIICTARLIDYYTFFTCSNIIKIIDATVYTDWF